MKLIIGHDVQTMFPDLRIGIVRSTGIDNTEYDPGISTIMQSAIAGVHANLTIETLTEHPFIKAWRTAYQQFGSKPSSYRPTAEATLRRIIKGESIQPISAVVDLYLAVELELYLPIGGYDLAHVTGDITLRTSPGDEPFTPIGASEATEKTYAGEIVYADAEKILTRRWNYRDCDAAKITTASTDIALFCEAPGAAIPSEALQQCTQRLADLLQQHCQGHSTRHFVEVQSQSELECS